MLKNVVDWLNVQETGRHNLATEQETHRHNVQTENISWANLGETIRHNQVTEVETSRHNVATELETKRHNIATENVAWATLSETQRHNTATEAIQQSTAQSTIALNKAKEDESYANVTLKSAQANAASWAAEASRQQAYYTNAKTQTHYFEVILNPLTSVLNGLLKAAN